MEGDIEFRVIVEGHPQPLHPILRDEVYRIGREAIVNAFRHSRAKKIEVEIEYAAKRFRFFVRDNGSGIDPELGLRLPERFELNRKCTADSPTA